MGHQCEFTIAQLTGAREMRHTCGRTSLCLTERGRTPPVKYGVTDPQLTGYRRDMTRFDEKCSLCEPQGGNRAKMSKSGDRFVNKRGNLSNKDAKKMQKQKKFEEIRRIGQIWGNRALPRHADTTFIALLGLVPSTEVVQRISVVITTF